MNERLSVGEPPTQHLPSNHNHNVALMTLAPVATQGQVTLAEVTQFQSGRATFPRPRHRLSTVSRLRGVPREQLGTVTASKRVLELAPRNTVIGLLYALFMFLQSEHKSQRRGCPHCVNCIEPCKKQPRLGISGIFTTRGAMTVCPSRRHFVWVFQEGILLT